MVLPSSQTGDLSPCCTGKASVVVGLNHPENHKDPKLRFRVLRFGFAEVLCERIYGGANAGGFGMGRNLANLCVKSLGAIAISDKHFFGLFVDRLGGYPLVVPGHLIGTLQERICATGDAAAADVMGDDDRDCSNSNRTHYDDGK